MHHVVMFSGGRGSYCAARRVVEEHGAENVTLLFADTKIEDADLYRFIREAASKLGARLEVIADGRDPWEVFKDRRYLGNTRRDPCSQVLKRELMDKWVHEHFRPEDVTCYVGVDWTEIHRYDRMAPRKLPYIYKAPMCEPPYIDRDEMDRIIAADGLALPRLYEMGFPHNNCGGFCVKAGQGQFKLLLEKMPERYAYHEAKEQEIREFLGKNVAILRDRRGGRTRPMTLRALRRWIEAGEHVDETDFGGCGCAID